MAIKKVKRPDGTEAWRAEVYVGRGASKNGRTVNRYERKTFAKLGDAKVWTSRRTVKKADEPEFDRNAHKTKFADVIEDWRASRYAKSPGTRRRDEGIVEKYLKPEFGSKTIGAVDRDAVERFIGRLCADPDLSAGTVRRINTTLGSIMQRGVATKLIKVNPCRMTEQGRIEINDDPDAVEMLCLEPEEITLLADAMPTERDRLIVLFSGWTGLRAGETLALQIKHLTLPPPEQKDEPGQVSVQRALKGRDQDGEPIWGTPKSKQKRAVPLPPFLVAELREHIAKSPGGKGRESLVFIEPGASDSPMKYANFYATSFKRAVVKALPEKQIRFHDLRHSFATNALAAGVPLTLVSEWMGHAKIDMTLRYAHTTPAMKARATNAMQSLYDAATKPNVVSLDERRSA